MPPGSVCHRAHARMRISQRTVPGRACDPPLRLASRPYHDTAARRQRISRDSRSRRARWRFRASWGERQGQGPKVGFERWSTFQGCRDIAVGIGGRWLAPAAVMTDRRRVRRRLGFPRVHGRPPHSPGLLGGKVPAQFRAGLASPRTFTWRSRRYSVAERAPARSRHSEPYRRLPSRESPPRFGDPCSTTSLREELARTCQRSRAGRNRRSAALASCGELWAAVTDREPDGIQEVEGATPFGSTQSFARLALRQLSHGRD